MSLVIAANFKNLIVSSQSSGLGVLYNGVSSLSKAIGTDTFMYVVCGNTILKISQTLELVWAKQLQVAAGVFSPLNIQIVNGTLVVSGTIRFSTSPTAMYIVLDTDGIVLFSKAVYRSSAAWAGVEATYLDDDFNLHTAERIDTPSNAIYYMAVRTFDSNMAIIDSKLVGPPTLTSGTFHTPMSLSGFGDSVILGCHLSYTSNGYSTSAAGFSLNAFSKSSIASGKVTATCSSSTIQTTFASDTIYSVILESNQGTTYEITALPIIGSMRVVFSGWFAVGGLSTTLDSASILAINSDLYCLFAGHMTATYASVFILMKVSISGTVAWAKLINTSLPTNGGVSLARIDSQPVLNISGTSGLCSVLVPSDGVFSNSSVQLTTTLVWGSTGGLSELYFNQSTGMFGNVLTEASPQTVYQVAEAPASTVNKVVTTTP